MKSKSILVLMMVVIVFCVCGSSFAGYLYGTGSDNLYKINPSDGTYIVIDDVTAVVDGLAYVPEPTTLLLFGLGAVMVRKKRS